MSASPDPGEGAIDGKPPAVSVIIVNFNSGKRLADALRHLRGQTFADFETIVVDNGSTDESIALAKASGQAFRLIDAGANLGFAAANNLAARSARGRWLALLNPDAYADDRWLEALLDAAARHPDIDAFGSMQVDATDPRRVDGAGDCFHVGGVYYRGGFGRTLDAIGFPDAFDDVMECFAPCAAAALYRAETFAGLGGFDETLFCYGEDVDFGFRLRLAGGRCAQVRDALVRHEGSGVTGRRSDFTVYHGHRNRIWVAYKNVPGAIYWPTLPLRWAAHLALFVKAALAGAGPAYLRAIRDGFLGVGAYRTARRELQAGRRAPLGELARAMAWNPVALLDRRAQLRKLPLTPPVAPPPAAR
ncbi:MAG: glycosyltransferase [Alphaproteobacteria bacterium]|nr:glycosyltransferase [Alphaproteobacteria bacterium]